MFAELDYRSTLEIYSTELQQIWQQGDHNTILGGRFQVGEFHTSNLQTNPVVLGEIIGFFDPTAPLAQQDVRSDFERLTFYGYHYWQIFPALQLVGGLAYDWIQFPENFRAPPVTDREKTVERLSPKAGFIWTPNGDTALRFAYARALAGASADQGILLEPSQVAGVNQAFRSILPESIGGAEAGAKFEIFGLALEQKIGYGTYLGISGQILRSQVERTLGTFEFTGESFFAQPSSTPESLDYTERTLLFTANQLVGKTWSLGASYRLTQADLKDDFTEIPEPGTPDFFILGFRPRQNLSAVLHQVALNTIYNHPNTGLFADFQAIWYRQSSQGYSPPLPGDDFWQLNIFAGYRFPRRKAEVRIGVLNLTDQNYRLNPLTLYNELPRGRTFAARLQFSF
jgi:outer membrane receptor protein involved in Fe transport